MSFFKRLFGKDDDASTAEETEVECPHVVLIAHWDNAQDMGNEERATSFRCEGCQQVFTPAEARDLRAHEAERLAKLA